MTDATTDFEMFAGDTRRIEVTVTDEASGSAIDLTGASIRWALSQKVATPELVEKKTSDATITIIDAAAGIFRVTLLPADTQTLKGNYYHEAELTEADGTVSTVLTGKVKIKNDLIRPGSAP